MFMKNPNHTLLTFEHIQQLYKACVKLPLNALISFFFFFLNSCSILCMHVSVLISPQQMKSVFHTDRQTNIDPWSACAVCVCLYDFIFY